MGGFQMDHLPLCRVQRSLIRLYAPQVEKDVIAQE